MFNDATALVAYKVAVAAAVTGGVAGGQRWPRARRGGRPRRRRRPRRSAASRGARWRRSTTRTPRRRSPSLVPFVAYVGAEHVNGSGVLAVLALGLYLRTYGHDATTLRGLAARSRGLELRRLPHHQPRLHPARLRARGGDPLDRHGAADTVAAGGPRRRATLVVFRAAWIYPAAWLARPARPADGTTRCRRLARDDGRRVGGHARGRHGGHGRGAARSVVASGEPLPATAREIVTVALVCVLVTLVVQGLTLTPLTRSLAGGQRRGRDRGGRGAAAAGQPGGAGADPGRGRPPSTRTCAPRPSPSTRATSPHSRRSTGPGPVTTRRSGRRARELESVLRRASDAERQLVLEARRRGEVAAGSADEVLRDIENRALRDFD